MKYVLISDVKVQDRTFNAGTVGTFKSAMGEWTKNSHRAFVFFQEYPGIPFPLNTVKEVVEQ